MSFARARAVRSLQNGLRQNGARPALRSNAFRRAQLQAKRFASSGGHGEHQQSSDLPWMLGALIITPPSCYYLWPSAHSGDHHDDHGSHDEHEEKHEEEEESSEEPAEEPAPEKEEESADEPAKEESDDAPADDGAEEPSSDASEPKKASSSGSTSGVNFKGKMKEDSEGQSHTVKIESDDKGGKKKRLDSGLQKNLGPALEGEDGKRDAMSQKQMGMSNTQTRHSIPIHESDEKSKKPDGTPETAKTVGTVNKKS